MGTMALLLALGAPAPEDLQELIRKAGTTSDEKERFRRLKELESRPGLDAALRADLAKILPIADEWANGKDRPVEDDSRAAENGYLCRFITGKVRPEGKGPVHPPPPSPGSPLRPIWCLYRGRMLIWRVIQSGPLRRVKEDRDAYYGEARRLLEEARKAFPENRVLRMYLGEPIPWPGTADPVPGAPEWARLQREGLEKLAEIIHWWADERQLEDGQFGGGWGDDVEMWRWWTPVLVAFEDPKAVAAQERISNGIFRRPHLKDGFTSRVTDVEHSNEDTTDTILPMMHLRPDDPLWQQRARRLADLMRERWTGRNRRGFLQYKSIYFSVDRVDESPARAFDTIYHPAIVQPALLLWQRTGDPKMGELFGEWLRVWVDAAARAENGKPAGVLPSALKWPEGTVGAPGKPWWEPFPPGHNDALYNWPGALRLMTSTLLLAWHMTGREEYLQPLRSMAALRRQYAERPPRGDPGSEAWCAAQARGALSDALAKYRLVSGDGQYDDLLSSDASGYVRFRLRGDVRALEDSLRRNAQAFASNKEAYTSEMRWTDRVMAFTTHYLEYLPEPAPPPPSPEILYTTATGDPGNPLVFPLNAVRWRTEPREIAALVTDSGRDRLAAELFHFGEKPRPMGAELYLLKPGSYAVTLAEKASGREIARRALAVAGPRTAVRFDLPPRTLVTLAIRPAGPDR